MNPLWSWVLTLMGVTCFFLAGRKVWWAWYVGLATQVVWVAYSVLTQQWGFLLGCVLYTAVYIKNARAWTAEHRAGADTQAPPSLDEHWNDEPDALAEAEPIADPSVRVGVYRKKPIAVEGHTWDGSYVRAQEILQWMDSFDGHGLYQEAVVLQKASDVGPQVGSPARLFVYTLEGSVEVSIGDTVMKGVENEFWPIKPSIIAATYDLIEVVEEAQ